MIISPPHQNVLLLADERVTSFIVELENPVRRFAILRIGTAGGASIPTWTMKAYDSNGKLVGHIGEKHGLPGASKSVAIEGNGIVRVEISTDNRNGAATWATWSSLPIAGFELDR